MDEAAILTLVEGHLAPILERQGLTLYDMELHRGRRHAVLRVFIDRPTGVEVGDCARVSEVLSTVLDAMDPIPEAYDLEVSSPGLTRKLTKPRHFEASAGHPVHLELRAPVSGHRSMEGVLRGLAGEGPSQEVRVEVGGEVLSVPLPDVASAQLTLPGPPARAGRPRRR